MAGTQEANQSETAIKHPDYDPTPILTLSRNVTLRALQQSDLEELVKHANNPKIAAFMTNKYPDPYTVAKGEEWRNHVSDPSNFVATGPFDSATLAGTLPPIPVKYAICVNDQAIGGIGLNFQTDIHLRTAELGYWIGEEFWRQGIASLVAPAFVAWAWETFGQLLRLEGYVFEGNPASCKILQKCGMRSTGKKECAVFKHGKILALDCFEMLRSDVSS